MGLLLTILLAVAAVIILAYVIVKFIPLKMRWLVSILLLAVAVFLGVKIYDGIMKPIKFDKDKKARYSRVIGNLKIIRDAEVKYNEVHGTFTKDKKALITFIENGKLVLTETKNITVKENRGGGIFIEVSKRKVDTTGYEPVLNYFKNRNYKDMFKVPGTNGKEFTIETGRVEKVAGLEVPVFIAKVKKSLILEGMDRSLVKQELEAITTDQIKGAFVSVGSLVEVTTGGNWPPLYDKSVATKKE